MHPPFKVSPDVADPPAGSQSVTDVHDADLDVEGEWNLSEIPLYGEIVGR